MGSEEQISAKTDTQKEGECVSHPGAKAVYECDKCGAEICDNCYDAFTLKDDDDDDEYHFCSDCYKEFFIAEAQEAISLKSMIVKEFVGIAIGMLLGLIIGIFIGLKISILTLQILIPILGMFVGGSFVTIVKKIYNTYQQDKDTSGDEYSGASNFVLVLMLCIGYILISPFTTLYRIIIRAQDMRALNQIVVQHASAISVIDQYVERIGQELSAATGIELAASGENVGEEISLDSIIGEGFDIGDNGEFLRKVRYR